MSHCLYPRIDRRRLGAVLPAGLIRTWPQRRGKAGTFYWISPDGTVLLRGDAVEDAELLQSTFADGTRRGDEITGRLFRLSL
jgi:hypothetical protein